MSDLGPMPGLSRCRLYVSGLRSDVGGSPRNVYMLDFFVILACVFLYVPIFSLMPGCNARRSGLVKLETMSVKNEFLMEDYL